MSETMSDTRVVINTPSGDGTTQVVLLAPLPNDAVTDAVMESAQVNEVVPKAESMRSLEPGDTPDMQMDIPKHDLTVSPNIEPETSTEQSSMTYLDMNQFMDVVYTYKCKFCSFSAKSPEEMSSHVLSIHVDCNFQNSESKVEDISPKDISETSKQTDTREVQVSIVDHMYNATEAEAKTDPGNSIQASDDPGDIVIKAQGNFTESDGSLMNEQPSDGECQEIFMCGQCTMSFSTMQLCKNHMSDLHNINVIEAELEMEQLEQVESISATSKSITDNKVSIGTQAMLINKPGRKRKLPPDDTRADDPSTSNDGKGSDLNADSNTKDPPDHADEIPEEMGIFSKEYLNDRVKNGKRRIKVPKLLQESYYGNKPKEYKKSAGTRGSRNTKNDTLKIKCDQPGCKVRFATESSRDHHNRCHRLDGEILKKGFLCPECTFTSMQWAPMRLHLWTKHRLDMDLLKCEQCEFHTDAVHKLEVHALIHDDERRYTCDTCDMPFKQLSQLLHHNANHNEERGEDAPYSRVRWYKNRQCHICKKILADSKCLKKHIEYVHDKVRSYSCEFCGHTAARKHMLQVHMRTHTGERPHKCDLCTFTTSDHNTLRRHRLRHTGEKPYKCKHCPYACIQAISLKIHMKNKHQDCDELYYCQQCHYHTVNRDYWLQHQRDHKSGLIEEQVSQRFLPEGEPAPKRQKNTQVISIKLPSGVPENIQIQDATKTVIQEISPGDSTIQEVQEIAEIVQAGTSEDLATLGQPGHDGQSNIRYVYLTQGEDGLQNATQIPATFLIEGVSTLEGEVMSALSNGDAPQTIQISNPGEEGAITLTIQPGGTTGQQLVATDPESVGLLVPNTEDVTEVVESIGIKAEHELECGVSL